MPTSSRCIFTGGCRHPPLQYHNIYFTDKLQSNNPKKGKGMYQYSDYEKSAQYIKNKISSVPETAVVLGSGLGELFRGTENITIPYNEIPNFPSSTAPGHKGEMIITDKAIIMSGRFHLYEGYSVEELVYYVRTLKLLGVKTLILTNAAGGVNTDFKTGDI